MDELFTMKSDTSIHAGRKKNNAQIVSTLRSETDTNTGGNNDDISYVLKNTTSSIKRENTYDKQYTDIGKNGIAFLQEDIVSIAESIHNLVKMVDEQREKMNFFEKEISKIGMIENEITKINENATCASKQNPQLIQILNKERDNEKKKDSLICSSLSNSNTTSTVSQKNPDKKSIILYKQKIPSLKIQSKSSLVTETVTDTGVSDSQSICEYNNSKEVEEKLNNITKGFNAELLDMKRKQALLAASYVKINKMR